MGDRSNVNIITEARADGTNVGVNVYLHWGGQIALVEALKALRPYSLHDANRSTSGQVSYRNDPVRMTTAVLHTLYRMGGYDEPDNVYVTPFSTMHDKATAFTGDNEHTIVTIDAPRGRIVLRDDVDGSIREFEWENVDEASHALLDMERGHGRL